MTKIEVRQVAYLPVLANLWNKRQYESSLIRSHRVLIAGLSVLFDFAQLVCVETTAFDQTLFAG
jgi:hypothetical protein